MESDQQEDRIGMEKVKQHFQRHGKSYLMIGGGILAGVAIGMVVKKVVIINGTQKAVVIGKDNTVNQVLINLVERSTPSKPVMEVATKRVFDSKNEAVRVLDITRNALEKGLHDGSFELLDVVA